MANITSIDYNIAESFLPYIINGDDSGISPEEAKMIDKWFSTEGLRTWVLEVMSEESEFEVCDICGMLASCHLVTAYAVTGSKARKIE